MLVENYLPSTSCIGRLLSFVILILFQSACTDLLIAGGAIPARTYTSLTLEFLRQPVTNGHGSSNAIVKRVNNNYGTGGP